MVPGSSGCGSTVFAAMATLAPSRAARSAIARPMPREPPVMNRVLPASGIMGLFVAELRRSLREEGGDALDEIGGAGTGREARRLRVELLGQRACQRFAHQ